MGVREAQQRIDSREYAEWIAYDQIEPIGPERGDLQAAIVASTIANVNRSSRSRAFTPDQFMPRFDRKAVTQTPEEMLRVLRRFAASRKD